MGEETRARLVHGLVEYLKSDSGVNGGLEESAARIGVLGKVPGVFGSKVPLVLLFVSGVSMRACLIDDMMVTREKGEHTSASSRHFRQVARLGRSSVEC
jgi:hypothetical protein